MNGSQIPFRKNYILGVSIILAAFVLGVMLVWTVRTLKSFDDTVTVKGLCEREVPADRVVLRISYTAQDNSLIDLRSKVENNDQTIVNLIKKAGIAENEIKYTTASFNDRYDDYYVSDNIKFRYNAHQTISIFSSNMDAVRKLQNTIDGELLKQDILSNTYASYEYNGSDSPITVNPEDDPQGTDVESMILLPQELEEGVQQMVIDYTIRTKY